MRRRHARSAALALMALVAALASASPPLVEGRVATPIDLDKPPGPKRVRSPQDSAADRERVAHRVVEALWDRLLAPPANINNPVAFGNAYPDPLTPYEEIFDWMRRESDAKLDQATTRAQRVAILTQDLVSKERFIQIYFRRLDSPSSQFNQFDVDRVEFRRLEAEERLAREMAAK